MRAEVVPVGDLEVVLRLLEPRDAAEQVLDGAGEHHEAVRLELGQRDEHVGLDDRRAQRERAVESATVVADPAAGIVEEHERHVLLGADGSDAESSQTLRTPPGRVGPAGAVADRDLAAGRTSRADDRADELGMRGDRAFRQRPREQVDLEKHALPGRHERRHPPERGEGGVDGGCDVRAVRRCSQREMLTVAHAAAVYRSGELVSARESARPRRPRARRACWSPRA